MSDVTFYLSWSEKTPGQAHVSFSGHRTPCGDGLPVIRSSPAYESDLKDVDCHECGAYVLFDMEAAHKVAALFVSGRKGTAEWGESGRLSFAALVAERTAATAFRLKRERGEWNSNMVFSEFMASSGLMADKDAEARLIGFTALEVLAHLKERA